MDGWFGLVLLDGLILSSDVATALSFASLYRQVAKTKSAGGVSLQTLLCLVIARVLHLLSHPLGLHYRPSTMPQWVFILADIGNATSGVVFFHRTAVAYWHTYERSKDTFVKPILQKISSELRLSQPGDTSLYPLWLQWGVLYAMIFVVGLFWFCVRKSQLAMSLSLFCCFYEVMCAMALLPQLWMFAKNRNVSMPLGNLVALTAINRMCTLLFWVLFPSVHPWKYPDNRGIQMVSESLNILILADFLFYYIRSRARGEQEILLPETMSDV